MGGRDRFRRDYVPRTEAKNHLDHKENPSSRHLWIGNLSPHATESLLSEHFLRFGELDSIAFIPGRSYAFVNFKKEEDAEIAMRGLQGYVVAGFPLKIEFTKGERVSRSEDHFRSRDERRSSERAEPFSRRDSRIHQASPERHNFDRSKGDKGAEPSEVLWIGFPSFLRIDDIALRRAFSPFGELEKVTAFPGRSYAFVQFRRIEAACRAKETLHGKLFDNPRVSICFAKSDHGLSEHGRNSFDGPFDSNINSKDTEGSGVPLPADFHSERNFGGSSSNFRTPHFVSDSLMSRDVSGLGFTRSSSIRMGAGSSFEQLRVQGLGGERGFSDDTYERHRRGPSADRSAIRRDFHHERPSHRSPLSEDSWDLPDDSFSLGKAKRAKTVAFPDKDLPEYPFSDLQQEKQHSGLPKFPPREHAAYDKIFEPAPYDYRQKIDFPKKKSLSLADRDDLWKTHDNFESGAGPLHKNPVNLQRFGRELHPSPPKEEWKWEGTIAKGGTPVCRARCFPVGKVLDAMLPEILNCTARTGLEMLAKHFYQATCFWVVFFVPETDADIAFYNEFMSYLGEKQRAAVAKLSEKTTLFLVPPSEFSEKVLKVPGKVSISGVILSFQHPNSNVDSNYSQLEAVNPKVPSLQYNRIIEGASFEDNVPYPKAASPNLRSSSSWAQGSVRPSLDPFPRTSSPFPLSKPAVGNLPFSEGESHSPGDLRYDQLHQQSPRLSSNWSSQQIPISNSSINFHSLAAPLPSDDSTTQKYLLGNPTLAQGTSSSQYVESSSFPAYGVKSQPQLELKPQLSQLDPKPEISPSMPSPLSAPLQPEQLAKLASLLGQRQHLEKASISSAKEDYSQPSLPNPPLQEFKTPQNLVLQSHAPAPDSIASQFSRAQQQASGVFTVSHPSNIEQDSGRASHEGNLQIQNGGSREEPEADPQKRLQATLQLAAALLQQIQQQAKTSEQK